MENTLVVSRIYPAPAEMVWKAWTVAELIKRWWGPDRFTCSNAIIDFKEGGLSRVSMEAPEEFGGQQWFNSWEYKKIVPLERIEFTQRFCDREGTLINPVEAGMPADFPEEVHTVVTFKALGKNETQVTVTQNADMGQMRKMARMGLEQSLDKVRQLFN